MLLRQKLGPVGMNPSSPSLLSQSCTIRSKHEIIFEWKAILKRCESRFRSQSIASCTTCFTIALAMVIYVSTLPWITVSQFIVHPGQLAPPGVKPTAGRGGKINCYTGLLLKTKGRKEISSWSEPEPKFPSEASSDILCVTKSNSPQRCTSVAGFNLCVLQKRPQVKGIRDYSGYRKCKIKTIKTVV